MKNKKGFTLVELLAVLAIIAIVGLIVVPTVDRVIKRSREQAYDVQVGNIEDAAKAWITENIGQLPEVSGDFVTVDLDTLIDGGYIDAPVINPITKENFETGTVITITKTGNQYTYVCDCRR